MHTSRLLILAALLALPLLARAGDDPFDKKNELLSSTAGGDPFDGKHALPDPEQKPAAAPPSFTPELRPNRWTDLLLDKISIKAKVAPAAVRPGEVVKLTLYATPAPGWYTYPITQRTADQLGPPTEINYQGEPELKLLWPIKESEPTLEQTLEDGKVRFGFKHKKEFSWEQDILVDPASKPGDKTLYVGVRLQVCKETCIGPGPYPPIPVKITVAGDPVPLTAELKKRLGQPKPEVRVVTPQAARSTPPGPINTDDLKSDEQLALESGLLGLLGSAALGAILMLLTPCVFPMIPITVNFFLHQAKSEHHNSLVTASVYCGTIIVVLTVIILTIGSVVAWLAVDTTFNLVMGLVLLVFALSLFGMYEIELPSWLAQWASAREAQGGYVGAIFMALTFTITSFTCTGPFLAALMAPVAVVKPPLWQLALAALVYSATFAAPFFLLALFPRMLKKLPKGGGWLNAVKVTMGFLEIALAAKFLSIVDGNLFPGDPKIFNYDVVLCSWIGLSALTGLYLIGTFRLPHDDPAEHIGAIRMLFAAFFFGFAIYMTPLLQGPLNKPAGFMGDAIASFLPQDFRQRPTGLATGPGGSNGGHAELTWLDDYEKAHTEAVKENKLIFIDFTGQYCQNCRWNEINVFPDKRVREQLEKYVRVQLYADRVPRKGLSPSESYRLAARHFGWLNQLAPPGLPTYVIFRPDPKAPFTADDKLNGEKIGHMAGQINDRDRFVRFLAAPLQQMARR